MGGGEAGESKRSYACTRPLTALLGQNGWADMGLVVLLYSTSALWAFLKSLCGGRRVGLHAMEISSPIVQWRRTTQIYRGTI